MRHFSGDSARFTIVAVGFVIGACTLTRPPESPPNEAAAEVLWTPTAADLEDDPNRPVLIRNGRSIYVDGSGAVVFSITAECADVARDISEHFDHTEWRPRSTQVLNPQLPTSFSRGCRPNIGGVIPLDSTGRPAPRGPFMDWHGEWENDRGDLVMYDVGGIDRRLRGNASYLPRDMVDELRRNVARQHTPSRVNTWH